MAYFPNGASAEVLSNQCARCPVADEPCPIALAQMLYNYDAVGNRVATDILTSLVTEDGQCQMLPLLQGAK